jgi:hypothetical protein
MTLLPMVEVPVVVFFVIASEFLLFVFLEM